MKIFSIYLNKTDFDFKPQPLMKWHYKLHNEIFLLPVGSENDSIK